MISICVINHDRAADMLQANACHEGFIVEREFAFGDALHRLRTNQFDVIVIAWHLPDSRGLDLCGRYRTSQGIAPVIMIGDNDSATDITEAFQSGADDFLPRIFHAAELFARVRALSRRSRVYTSSCVRVGPLLLDPIARRVYKDGVEIHLLAKEFSLLELLMRYPRHNFTAEAIRERVWNSSNASSTDTVRTHIKTLRHKLGEDTHGLIVTRRGLGYSFEPNAEQHHELVSA